MIRPHNPDATATAFIKGLAIAAYDKTKSRWNVRLLRNCGHYPQLRIRELNRRDGAVISIIKTYEIAAGDALTITVTRANADTKPSYTTGGIFERSNAKHDPQDLRWILDLDQLLGRAARERANPIETNILSISDGCFYTAARARGIYRRRYISASGERSSIEPFEGLTGRTFGVDFEGKSVTIEINGTNGFTETLAHQPDSRYEIVFDNTCYGENQPSPGETDFQDYYKLIDDRDGKVEILPPEKAEDAQAINRGGSLPGEPPPTPGEEDGEEDDDDPPKSPACHVVMSGGGQ